MIFVEIDFINKKFPSIPADISVPRSALSLTVLDGKLFALGGFDGNEFLSMIEIYYPDEDIWRISNTSLPSGRSGHAAAVIYHPAGCFSEGSAMCSESNLESTDDVQPK